LPIDKRLLCDQVTPPLMSYIMPRRARYTGIQVDPGFLSFKEGDLWAYHDEKVREARRIETDKGPMTGAGRPLSTLLDIKIELAMRMLQSCQLCERRCGINRLYGQGACGVDSTSHISSEFLHMGEESELIPSHTIFLEGCNFTCAYCQNWEIATRINGPIVDIQRICSVINLRHRQGSANVNFVGGDPTPHLHTILKIVRCMDSTLPVIWNSNMYMTQEAMKLLDGVIDVYLADFRYGDDEHALRYSGIGNYWAVATRNFLEAARQTDVLVRQLVLPGHIECCTRPIVEWCAENLGKTVRFNLMFQYYPEHRTFNYPEINRTLTSTEVRRAMDIARDAGLSNLV